MPCVCGDKTGAVDDFYNLVVFWEMRVSVGDGRTVVSDGLQDGIFHHRGVGWEEAGGGCFLSVSFPTQTSDTSCGVCLTENNHVTFHHCGTCAVGTLES